jgi:hypothetical protein
VRARERENVDRECDGEDLGHAERLSRDSTRPREGIESRGAWTSAIHRRALPTRIIAMHPRSTDVTAAFTSPVVRVAATCVMGQYSVWTLSTPAVMVVVETNTRGKRVTRA